MKTANCRTCKQNFEYPPRRGRPPVECEPCKAVPEIVDEPIMDAVESDEPIDWGGPHGLGSVQNHITFKTDDIVRISGDNGRYRIYRDNLNTDGSYTVYGGSTDLNGIRGFRAVMPSRLSYDKRKKLR